MEEYNFDDSESSKKWKDVFNKLFSEFGKSEDGESFIFDTTGFTTDFNKLISNQQKKMDKNLNSIGNINPGLFMQRLDDNESKEEFDKLVKQFDMVLNVDIITENGKKLVIEKWSSDDVNIKKVYPLSKKALSHLDIATQISVLEKQLEQAVIVENFEEASELRDIINKLKSK